MMIQPFAAQSLAGTTRQQHEAMDRCMSNVAKLLGDLEMAIKTHHAQMTLLLNQLHGAGQAQLLNATKQMQEMQMSFNRRYLQIHAQMQQENRSYTAVSNVMKAKRDAEKNSLNNVR
jgi:hypothetical protein